jgi:uncharacterized protein with FMN-binding domain
MQASLWLLRGIRQCAAAGILVLLGLISAAAGEDVVELKSGARPKGKVVSQNDEAVVLQMTIGGKQYTRRYPRSQVKNVILDESSGGAPVGQPGGTAAPKAGGARSKPEVLALIDSVGRTPPDWYEATPLNYPQTLDLSWPEKPPGGWNNQKNVGQYVWDRINPNPGNWREGVKLMHHIMSTNADKPEVVKRAMGSLGNMYHNLHEDYARAAFWWQQMGVDKNPDTNPNMAVHLADAYHKLGSRQMALDVLNKMTRYPYSVIKVLGDLGETSEALELAERFGKKDAQAGVISYLYAGDVCRVAGRLDDAEQYYRRALSAAKSDTRDNDHSRRDQQRAEASLAAIQFYRLTPDKVRDGTYTARSLGYEDQIEVAVTVASGKIESVKVTQHREKQFYSSIADTPRNIVAKQSVVGVDTTSGATITSEAIINATAKALSQGAQ